mmetsp:Transcript_109352/g.172346  ORF Transcript_109352/g.172346 Transcript_109352/m.172346 type:complete len:356 (-) Transcript_109352:62-1129(-)
MRNGALQAAYILTFTLRSVSTESFGDTIVRRFYSHLDDFQNGEFEYPHVKKDIGLTVYISKHDTDCGGTNQPYYHLSFDVPNARPVDVFNLLAATTKQDEWLCKGCTVSMLKEDLAEQVQGLSATYNTGLLLRREFYQWAAFDANFENETFLTGVIGDQRTDELRAIQSPLSDALVAEMCYSFSYITKTPKGAHVVQMSHFDAKIPQMWFGLSSPRNLYAFIWPIMTSRIPRIIAHSQYQAELNWDPNQIVVSPELIASDASTAEARMSAVRLRQVSNESSDASSHHSGEGGDDSRTLVVVGSVVAICMCVCSVVWCCAGCCRKTKGTRWSPIGEDVEACSDDTARSEVEDAASE